MCPPNRLGRLTDMHRHDYQRADMYSYLSPEQRVRRQIGGAEFEHWVADLFRKGGFQVETTPQSGDHGVDLFIATGGHVIAVQCKRWEGTVGEPVERDLYGAMMATNAKPGCQITTGRSEERRVGKPGR